MAQENYVDRCSMQRPPLLNSDGFYFWKTRFETYIKSKDIDLWQLIYYGDFIFEMEDPKTKMVKETPYDLLKNDKKKKLGKNNEANMTLYNALPHQNYPNKNHVRTFLCALPLKCLKVYEMVLENYDVVSKIAKEKVKSLALKAKVIREQTSDDSDS
nr:hypothetical protein [Tanacetum cinerariifolium]